MSWACSQVLNPALPLPFRDNQPVIPWNLRGVLLTGGLHAYGHCHTRWCCYRGPPSSVTVQPALLGGAAVGGINGFRNGTAQDSAHFIRYCPNRAQR